MIGDRIRLARAKANLSLQGLSDAMGGRVSKQAIGKYERGEDVPSSGVLIALADALGVSLNYLLDAQGVSLSQVDFRKKASTTVRERAQVETAVLEWIERYLQIEAILELDSAEWQSPVRQLHPMRGGIADAETLARQVRKTWRLGEDPIPNLTELLEENGLKVLVVSLPARVSGFTCLVGRPGGRPPLPVIVVNRDASLERRRLTLAHELAHRLIESEGLSHKDEERAATAFAGALLMPGAHLLAEVGKHRQALGYRELITLKRLYRVSGAALLVRLQQIGVINEATLTYAFQSVARSWRTAEPEELEPMEQRGTWEQPRRFPRLCYRALAESLISLSKAAELLQLPVAEVEFELKGPPPHADRRQ